MTADERDTDLDGILIGGREKRSIVIVDYDDQWPARFEHHRERVQSALGAEALRIGHIGSTAVPGLAAKPIIDMLVTVRDPDDESTFAAALASAGYHLRVREPQHRMFRTPEHDVHVHIWSDSDPDVRRQLNLRDRLRRSADDRRAYERLKRELAARDWPDMNAYADAKGALIEDLGSRRTALTSSTTSAARPLLHGVAQVPGDPQSGSSAGVRFAPAPRQLRPRRRT